MTAPIRIGDLLKEKGFITDAHIRYALQVQRVTKEKLGQVLTSTGLVSEYGLVHTVAQQLGLEHIKLDTVSPDYKVLKLFSRTNCLNLRMFPLKIDKEHVTVAISDIPEPRLEQNIARSTGLKAKFVMAEESHIVSAIYNNYFFLDNPIEKLMQQEVHTLATDTSRTTSPDALVNYILLLAVKQRATDIHIRPMGSGIALAFRVDGVLSNKAFFPPQLFRLITSIKLQANMDIAEQRLPQDGRWTAKLLEKRYDIRASSVVTPFGENIVLRLLSQEQASFNLESLGFLDEDRKTLQKIFDEPFGLLLLTGPTGSGKSTTLVAGLTSLDLLGKNAMTVENPIEYVMPLARQTQVNEAAGYDFSNAMRYFLRHDPDIILIGEMRDTETASTALTAATTGHMVMSTLHSNTAIGSISRLRSLNVDTAALAESLVGVVSQRLIRVICHQCVEEYTPTEQEIDYLKEDVSVLYRGKGCEACGFSGYYGRTLIYEVMAIDNEVRKALEQYMDLTPLEEMLKKKGFRDMFDVGKAKVFKGDTTVEELRRVLGTARY